MCGISGIYNSGDKVIDIQKLEKSTLTLEKRGPDASGTWVSKEKTLGFGHRRLSILDVSTGANQPMTTSDGTITIVFNGEIFNFYKLREDLQDKGYVFWTNSDTEVLLNLFHCYGNVAWEKLNGFFAVALYNEQTKKLTLVRDRFGIKPLYYSFSNGSLIFGSEMKALFPFGLRKEIDTDALQLYLTLNYIPAPYSILKDVKKLMPGHFLEFDGIGLEIKQYYSLPQTVKDKKSSLDYKSAKKKLYGLMEQSVNDRLVSDVPIGTFLSGGIDSSVITALASQQIHSLNTFSVGFKDNKFFDETSYARLVAEKYKTNHTEIILGREDLLTSLEELLNYTDEPFADSSALAVNALCKETRKSVTVSLSGDGADEVFGGYNKYLAEFRAQNLGFAEKFIVGASPLWNSLPKSRNNPLTNTFRKLDKFAKGAKKTKKERYIDWCSIGKEELVNALLLKKSKDFIKIKSDLSSNVLESNGISDILLNDIQLVLPNDMLAKVDFMSMRNSLEVRVPFLDYRVVEFACELPDNYKINGDMKKRIVQDAFRDLLPMELYNRPKHGFEVPMLDWLKKDLDEKIRTIYLEKEFINSQGIFDFAVVEDLLKKLHSTNPEDSHATVWALVVFQHWYLSYIAD